MLIGSKVYYALSSGNVIQITPEFAGNVTETTKEQDFELYKALAETIPASVGMIQLEYGAFTFDRFKGGQIVSIDLDTKEPLWKYPVEPGTETSPPTVSLESQINNLNQRLAESDARNEKLAEENTLNQIALMELHALFLSTLPDEGNAE
ncbi:hypothetical protein HUB98_26560 [Paenibacillus barcinonensis]|uniref:Uncharacterized protein n=1 Tax=Paenibacillus barcinonensis TaxID=198119 RepID=A0A2V4VGK7_PAEBA|nr:hypothetical protein [Paenibacillus barcinonensis]PYE52482.1 hypothetical protein DFQ00_101420 [Paenibacillus barcinonensis]QKS59356.1 hypothetical protein HUB98_26230 [Paenibacillus barcinonensis]QKS59414.1 hypothetical protein HUB98_26560 [Paenibacillus barcinonensis]